MYHFVPRARSPTVHVCVWFSVETVPSERVETTDEKAASEPNSATTETDDEPRPKLSTFVRNETLVRVRPAKSIQATGSRHWAGSPTRNRIVFPILEKCESFRPEEVPSYQREQAAESLSNTSA